MPLSSDPDRRGRQLSNLRQGGVPAAPAGHDRSLKHGATATIAHHLVTTEIERELYAWLEETSGLEPDARFVQMVELTALCMARLNAANAWCKVHGYLDEKTHEPKPAARWVDELSDRLQRYLIELNRTPKAADAAEREARLAVLEDIAARYTGELAGNAARTVVFRQVEREVIDAQQ